MIPMWLKIFCMCVGGFLLGLALRTVLPQSPRLFIMGNRERLVLPLNRLAFWACVLIGLVTGAILVGKAMLRDHGLR
jgi:hypothetical protein